MGDVIISAKLVDDDNGDELVITPSDTIDLLELNLGFPELRAVEYARAQADGVDDETSHHGARAVSLRGEAWGDATTDPGEIIDALTAFLLPSKRPRLVYQYEGQVEREITLRSDQFGAPLIADRHLVLGFQVSWRAPDGRVHSTAVATASADAGDTGPGRTYPLTFDRDYPDGGTGAAAVVNDGTAVADPVIKLYGPCTDPRVENVTVGRKLEFTDAGGITLAAGDYLEIRPADRTVRLNGDADRSRYKHLDFSTSSWWSLQPGHNGLRYYPVSFSGAARLEVEWQHAWL